MTCSIHHGPVTSLPESFHRLTEDDESRFSMPSMVELSPPETGDERAAQKRRNWISWRAAPYPADRHSEYLYRPDVDECDDGPRILISAVLPVPNSMHEYVAGLPRNRRYDLEGRTATNHGYTCRPICPAEEAKGIFEIVHSSDTRQGRDIAPMFADRAADAAFDDYTPYDDPNYRDICTGVFSPAGELAAYLLGRRVGDHVFYDEIMAHAAHRRRRVMWLLHAAFIEQCLGCEVVPRILHYGPWYSGANPYEAESGLNQWKRKARFKPAYLIHASSSADSRGPAPPC